MAISTYMVFLMHNNKSGSPKWEKLVDIKNFPDLGGDPEMIETTTLSDKMQTFINGIQSAEGLKFEANYDRNDFKKVKELESKKDEEYAVWFGGTEGMEGPTPTGTEGKFSWKGGLSVYATGGGVNEAIGMSITIAPSTPIKDVTDAA